MKWKEGEEEGRGEASLESTIARGDKVKNDRLHQQRIIALPVLLKVRDGASIYRIDYEDRASSRIELNTFIELEVFTYTGIFDSGWALLNHGVAEKRGLVEVS